MRVMVSIDFEQNFIIYSFINWLKVVSKVYGCCEPEICSKNNFHVEIRLQ